jgi:hypothetical protein
VLFPDSAYNFEPFEYSKKRYFPTRTNSGISQDSAVYYLTTFEVDRAQYLSLPVYVLNVGDCTAFSSNRDSVRLIELVKDIPDTIGIAKLPLMSNTLYHKVNLQFNYILLLIGVGLLVIIAVIVWAFFGKRIARYLKTKRMKKRHQDFIAAYNETLNQIQKAFSSATTENAVSQWKKYMEQLERHPYTKLTTRETLRLQNDDLLGKSLRNIDMAIYGHNSTVVDSLEYLKNVADQRFVKKLEEVNHGK